MQPGRVELREFEYVRHGTLTLIGNFHVVTGEIVATTLGPTRTEQDFVAHVTQTVATDPEASWVFVVDNLNIHCSESLVNWVAQTCGFERELGKKGRRASRNRKRRGRNFCRIGVMAFVFCICPSIHRGSTRLRSSSA